MEINQKIRELRISKGISQVFVAKELWISVSAYNMKETGKCSFKAQELKCVAKVLNEKPAIFLNNNST
ncbi:helix-turn-helix transcriptional regulator [Bacillus cereus group sp. BfR-BA-01428]|uniref:helix-turn-helix domain-containing protein n=1 Tax=Bacillus cereus group sp. BfR-BA-01428 TaxID=2920345 RepID=UPI001F579945|nr:helix-turn-helix domain-containing protein [Bacillus cereus]MDA1845382.1 helix-turn-helix transcriptional regulator [Bacillus cereus]